MEPLEPTARKRLAAWSVPLRLWRAETLYVLALAVFAVLALGAHFYRYFGWDLWAAHYLQRLPIPGLFGLMRAVSLLGDDWTPYALTAVTALVLLVFHLRHEAAGLLLSVGIGQTANRLLKWLIARPRPTPDLVSVFRSMSSQSFPSGHVTFYVCYLGFLFFVAYALLPRGALGRRLALWLTALPILLVGLSRIYLGEHWPSDTLGAYLFSGVWLGISLDIYRRWKQRAVKAES